MRNFQAMISYLHQHAQTIEEHFLSINKDKKTKAFLKPFVCSANCKIHHVIRASSIKTAAPIALIKSQDLDYLVIRGADKV